mgnify:CR=1 FL=1
MEILSYWQMQNCIDIAMKAKKQFFSRTSLKVYLHFIINDGKIYAGTKQGEICVLTYSETESL